MAEEVLGEDGAGVETRSLVVDPPRIALTDITDGPRYAELDLYESHFRLTQDDSKQYDWDGYFRGHGAMSEVKPNWYVPLSRRKPSSMMPLAKLIVGRLTSMALGEEPTISVEGDEDAEAYVRELAKSSKLFLRAVEARTLGGSMGSVAMSYAYLEGVPRVEVHNSKHCRILRWEDRSELVVGAFLKAYSYVEEELDEKTGRPVQKKFFYARYIDDTRDLVWERIPERIARSSDWATLQAPDREGVVVGGRCPVVWIQNQPQTSNSSAPRATYDGPSDYDGMCPDLSQIHRLKSASTKGTIANVDPTLVVKDDQNKNSGSVGKGSGTAIYSKGGAEYLTLPGDGMTAAAQKLNELRSDVLDGAGVVAPAIADLASSAKSAAALRIVFAPMTAVCSLIRLSYGEGIERVLLGLLKLARELGADAVKLPVQFERLEHEAEEGEEEPPEAEMIEIVLVPGDSEQVRLVWPPFFSPTWTDKKMAIEAAKGANGGKAVVSHRTSVRAVAQLFGVEDPDAEFALIEEDSERGLDREIQALGASRGPDLDVDIEGLDPKSEDDGEQGGGARADGGPGTKKPEKG